MQLALLSWPVLLGCGRGDVDRDELLRSRQPEPTPVVQMNPPERGAVDPFVQAQRLGRGINIGNALDAPSEGAWGVTVKVSQFENMAEAGFDSVRLPVRWSAHAEATAPFTINASFFERVDWAIAHAFDHELAVVLNVHHFEEIHLDPENNLERLLALWSQLSEHYQDYPKELYFELLNEPNDQLVAEVWNDYAAQVVELIRERNPGRTLLIGGENWNNIESLSTLRLPDDDNIIATFHHYEPFDFTHQGASWVDPPPPVGREFPEGNDESEMRDAFERAVQWSVEHARPLHLGEFGAFEAADMDSRANFTRLVVELATEHGIPFHYWEYESGFGAFDPGANSWREPLLEALLAGDPGPLPLQAGHTTTRPADTPVPDATDAGATEDDAGG